MKKKARKLKLKEQQRQQRQLRRQQRRQWQQQQQKFKQTRYEASNSNSVNRNEDVGQITKSETIQGNMKHLEDGEALRYEMQRDSIVSFVLFFPLAHTTIITVQQAAVSDLI
jgi:hypothetical protein